MRISDWSSDVCSSDLQQEGFTNVLLEISNEYSHGGYGQWKDGDWLRSADGQVALINHAKRVSPGLLVSTSGMGDGRVDHSIALAADFILLHFNNTPTEKITERVGYVRTYGKHNRQSVVEGKSVSVRVNTG